MKRIGFGVCVLVALTLLLGVSVCCKNKMEKIAERNWR